MPTHKVVIVGGACAGLTAALYAARANLAPLVIEGFSPMGQLMLTTEVENFPGFPEGIQGPDLMQRLREQAARFGASFITADATAIDVSARPFTVSIGTETVEGETLIIATGATPRMLGVPGEREHLGYGVSTCATCDGFFFRDLPLVVAGGGDSAMEESLFLTQHASQVTVVHRRDRLRASKIMQERALSNPKIRFLWDTEIREVLGSDHRVTGLVLENVKAGTRSEMETSALFVAIGHTPNSQLVAGQLDMDAAGYIVVKHPTTETSVEGVFACGDVVDHRYRQAITAAGTGSAAAIDAERFLQVGVVE